jgi:imidazolonepropionase-like amidohydrolase
MTIIVRCGTLFDGKDTATRRGKAVVIENGRINAVLDQDATDRSPQLQGATIIDAGDKFVMPGLVNVHDHLIFRDLIGNPSLNSGAPAARLSVNAVRNSVTALRRGWTTIRDMGASHGLSLAFRDYLGEGYLPGPRVVACGSPISVTGGHASRLCVEADGPYEVRRAARGQLKAGADFIKVMASHDPIVIDGVQKTRPEMALDEIRAAYDEAKAHGKRTACHVMGTIAIGRVLDAGVDVISHGFYLNDEQAARMAEQGVYLDPTLSSYGRQTISPKLKRGERWAELHMPLIPAMEDAFRAAVRAKVKIVTGTDSAGRYAEDVAMMREFGLDAGESLLACTRHAAEALALDHEIGTVEPGKVADLVVLDADPLADAYALERVHLVVQGGKPFRPEEIRLESFV